MPLATLDFLGGIVASLAGLISRAHTLTTKNGGGGLNVFADRHSCDGAQDLMESGPSSISGPTAKVIINGLPRAKILGEHPPSTAGADQVEDAIDHLAQVGEGTPAPFAFGQ